MAKDNRIIIGGFRVSKEFKEQADKFFEEYDLTVPQACKLFVQQCVRTRKFSLYISLGKPEDDNIELVEEKKPVASTGKPLDAPKQPTHSNSMANSEKPVKAKAESIDLNAEENKRTIEIVSDFISLAKKSAEYTTDEKSQQFIEQVEHLITRINDIQANKAEWTANDIEYFHKMQKNQSKIQEEIAKLSTAETFEANADYEKNNETAVIKNYQKNK